VFEIILVILIGTVALGMVIWFVVRQFKARGTCSACPFSEACDKENKNKCK